MTIINSGSGSTGTGTGTSKTTVWKQCTHDGIKPVMIGGYPIHLGAGRDLDGAGCIDEMDFIISLNGQLPSKAFWGQHLPMIDAYLVDHGGVPEIWAEFIQRVADWMREGKRMVGYCIGGHGRTGTLGASLIAVMEPDVADPIAAIRERHCKKAVESREQAIAIFKLKGMELPQQYDEEFTDWRSRGSSWSSGWSAWDKDKDKKSGGHTHHQSSSSSSDDWVFTKDFDKFWARWRDQILPEWMKKYPDKTEAEVEEICKKAFSEAMVKDDTVHQAPQEGSQDDLPFEGEYSSEMRGEGTAVVECAFCTWKEPANEMYIIDVDTYLCEHCYLGDIEEDDETPGTDIAHGQDVSTLTDEDVERDPTIFYC